MEEWRDIPGWEGYYQASNLGNLKGVTRTITRKDGVVMTLKEAPLKLTLNKKTKHYQVDLTRDGKSNGYRVHQLVALTFLGVRPDGMEVRHINDDPSDNREQNLAYGTRRENMLDRGRNGINTHANKTHCKRGHLYSGENLIVRDGKRSCRSCLNGKAYSLYHGLPESSWQQVMDSYYEKYQKESTNG